MKSISKRSLVIAVSTIMAVLMFTAYLQPSSAASRNSYWLKVNQKRNVITAYKKINRKWKPVRAMLCSTGVNVSPETSTYNGTWRTSSKKRWLTMSLDGSFFDYGQYTAHLYGGIYIHSVWYYAPKHNAQARAEFNKLGRKASHGCIRVSTADAKWMYDNCPAGTKVTIYSSSKLSKLGKPKAIHVPGKAVKSWDPTDPAKGNPLKKLMPKPLIRINKSKNVNQYGSYMLMSGVSAIDPNSFMSLNKYTKISKLQFRASGTKAYKAVKPASFTTKNAGTYKVTYYVNDPWGRSNSKNFFIHVIKAPKPGINGAKDRVVETNSSNAATGITGVQGKYDRSSAVKVTITTPSGQTSTMSLAQAKKYVFSEEGRYKVTYTLTSKYDNKVTATATVTITAKSAAKDNTSKNDKEQNKNNQTVNNQPADNQTANGQQTGQDELPTNNEHAGNSSTVLG